MSPPPTAAGPPRRPPCLQRPSPPPVLAPGIERTRARALVSNDRLWNPGRSLRYAFFDPDGPAPVPGAAALRGTDAHRETVRAAFRRWAETGMGLALAEVDDLREAELRVGFQAGDRHWSEVGVACLAVPAAAPTMNLAWTPDEPGDPDLALHEVGHALGLEHEHRSPASGLVWDEEAVHRHFGALGWSGDEIADNVLLPLPLDGTQASRWDPDSIMHYAFDPGLILHPEPYASRGIAPAGGLSPMDEAWVRTIYPPLDPASVPPLEPGRSVVLPAAAAAGALFSFDPPASGRFRVGTFGRADTVLTVFEADRRDAADPGAWRFLCGQDDGGTEANAQLEVRVRSGRAYRIGVRVRYGDPLRPPALLLW